MALTKKLDKKYNSKKLNGLRDTLDHLEIIAFDQNGCFELRSIKWWEFDGSTVNNFWVRLVSFLPTD